MGRESQDEPPVLSVTVEAVDAQLPAFAPSVRASGEG